MITSAKHFLIFVQAAEKHMSETKGHEGVTAYVEDPYPELSELMPIDLISFAYQIASGMVSQRTLTYIITFHSLLVHCLFHMHL